MSKITSGRKSNIDMTQGVIWKQLVLFAIPLIIGNIFQQLYNTVDSIVVGKLSRNIGAGCGRRDDGDLQYAGKLL